MKTNTLIAIALTLFSGCAGYDKTYQSYSQSVSQINAAQAQAAAAYYNLKAEEIRQQTALKIAAIQHSASGQGSVIFIGSDTSEAVPVFNVNLPSAPDPAPGAKYALEFGKAAVYGVTAGVLGHEIFSAIRDVSGTVSNVSNTVTNANQANKTVSVSDSGNSSTDSSNSGNTEDKSKTVTVSDSGNTTDNSVTSTTTDTRTLNITSSGNTTDNSDQSDNSDNSDNSTHDNDNSTTENILPAEPAVTE